MKVESKTLSMRLCLFVQKVPVLNLLYTVLQICSSSSSLSSSSKIKISFPASSIPESVTLVDDENGFVSSSKSFNTSICDFSLSLPAAHGCACFKQWITSSSKPSTLILSPHDLNDFLMSSLDKDTHESRIYCTIRFRGGALRLPSAVSLRITSSTSHSSYFCAHIALKGLFHTRSGARIYFVHPPGIIT